MGEKLAKLKDILGEVADLRAAESVLSWDQQTYMPPGGTDGRAMALSTLSRVSHERFVSDQVGELLESAQAEVSDQGPDSDDVRLLRVTRRLYRKERKVPAEYVAEFSRITALANQTWQQARAESKFSIFQDHLVHIVKMRRQYADFFAPYDSVYDPLLDDFEPGMKTAQIKAIFDALRPRQVELIQAISAKGPVVDDSILHKHYPEDRQWTFGIEVAQRFGYDLSRGRQDRSTHPFTSGFNTGDVRITTRFDPNYLTDALFSTLHETGHALYEQGIPARLDRKPLASALSMAIHESQSRTWENLVGRSRAFWMAFYRRLQELFPENLSPVDLETFYRAVNKVSPSLIRVDADEATYNLHIMLRFDLELSLMEGTLAVPDLPQAWNGRMQDYLGLTPPDDAKGVLQDIHWSFGGIGYFPTYALGNLVAAQLWETILKAIPDLPQQIEHARFDGLLAWLRENLHQHGGKFEPMELIERTTGAPLSPEPYLRYLKGKYGEIYRL